MERPPKKPKAHENKSLETIKYSFSGRDESAKEVFIDLGKKGDTTSERHIVTLRLTLKIHSIEKSKIPPSEGRRDISLSNHTVMAL